MAWDRPRSISPLQGFGVAGVGHPGHCPGLLHPAPSGLRTKPTRDSYFASGSGHSPVSCQIS